jgi:hypothetical protein
MKKIISIPIIILILSVFVFALTQDELINAKTCDTSGITYIFDKFSNGDQTGIKIDPKTGDVVQYVCKDGKWIPTQEWANKNNVDVLNIKLGARFLVKEQYDKALTCSVNRVTKLFDKFEESNQIGVTIDVDTGKATEFRCDGGTWIPTLRWCEENHIDIATIQLDVNYLTPDQYDKALTCDLTSNTQVFNKFDEGNQIGFMIDEKTGQVTEYKCDGGTWIPTLRWCEENHIDIATIQINNPIVPSVIDEKGRDIIYSTNPVIVADRNKEVVYGDKIINITVPVTNNSQKIIIKCICEKAIGCKIKECI